jgi:hypothetical protein
MMNRTQQALAAAEKSLNELLNGGFSGLGCIPAHFKQTRESTEAALSLVRLAIQDNAHACHGCGDIEPLRRPGALCWDCDAG